MLTPAQFPSVLADDYPQACAVLGLEPAGEGYGLLFGQDAGGARWTVAITDTALVACALAAWDCGLEYDLSPDERYMAAALPGWPLPVAVAAPGVPDPHDPSEEEGGRPPLTPPDMEVWGGAQRRLGADEIALRWRAWREQLDEGSGDGTTPGTGTPASGAPEAGAQEDGTPGDETAEDGTTRDMATADGTPGVGTSEDEPPAPIAPGHAGVRRALADAEEYLSAPPPPGRVRSAHGAVRADGPGWSLVARTDDMAFVLLDDDPGEVHPVRRGPALPALLEALDRLAARPV
ncbi:hypothetical protein QMK19_17555 [Streptomyces sp. H10-C2]|uniref:hypothetical protein n=1 Tax=unclassified Streptomyces TaxID=2593676 RepID=UPI0024BB390E|nr:MULTISPECIES: hypothetical protein [unclassified Streptomyces]MDJ0342998.1 hypothetical protein [Streptomyces sp. PH10-H1]MDJ0371441.1 hypothetical protein [Streptomyces sp. H10-C2]